MISTGNFHLIRVCSIFLPISPKLLVLNLSSNFTKMVTIKSGLFDCERMISVDYIMNARAREHSKVRLPVL